MSYLSPPPQKNQNFRSSTPQTKAGGNAQQRSPINMTRWNIGIKQFDNLYDKQKDIGHGAYAHVYKCTDLTTNKTVAIKQALKIDDNESFSSKNGQKFTKNDCNDFKKESEISKYVSDKFSAGYGAVKVYDTFFCRKPDTFNISMHFYEDGDGLEFAQWYKKNFVRTSATKESEGLSLLSKYYLHCVSFLDKIHSAGILHRDIKLDNYLWTKRNHTLAIADFGCACSTKDRCDQYDPDIEHDPTWFHDKMLPDTKTDVYDLATAFFSVLVDKIVYPSKNINTRENIFMQVCDIICDIQTKHADNKDTEFLTMLQDSLNPFDRSKRPSAAQIVRKLKS